MLLLPLAFAAGTMLPGPPTVPPGRVAPPPTDPEAVIAAARRVGDVAGEVRGWRALPHKDAASWYALGFAERRRGDELAASVAFAQAREGPVAAEAAWEAARSALAAGQARQAAFACARYRNGWPDGPHAEDCLLLSGQAWLAAGEPAVARATFNAWLARNDGAPMAEQARLGVALATAELDPYTAIGMLTDLSLDHQWHPAGVQADRALAALGVAIPDTVDNRIRRAEERLRCGFRADAWAAFERLRADPEAAAWVDRRGRAMMAGSRHFDALIETLPPEEHEERAKAFGKAGRWEEAAAEWRAAGPVRAELARAEVLAGAFVEARADWDTIGGDEGPWMAAYAAFRAADYKDARARLAAIQEGPWARAARYYEARVLAATGDNAGATAAWRAVIEVDPHDWYGLLAQQELDPPPAEVHDGRWHGPVVAVGVISRVHMVTRPALPSPVRARAAATSIDWSRRIPGEATAIADLVLHLDRVPAPARPDWRPADLRGGRATLEAYAEVGGEATTTIPYAIAAAGVGLYDHAGPALALAIDALGPDAVLQPTDELTVPAGDFLRALLYAGDAADAYNYGKRVLVRTGRDAEGDPWVAHDAVDVARAAQYPTPWADPLYRYSPVANLDPLLALGLMRQESAFNPNARSWIGAMGLIQVMPRTGGRIATLLGRPSYSPADLVDTELNLRFGTWYLGQLLDRFDGAFPLAVASYNGGPHNVAAWLHGNEGTRMDDFVEEMAFPETRDYVKRVSSWYAGYVRRYGAAGARVVPGTIAHERDPNGIDF